MLLLECNLKKYQRYLLWHVAKNYPMSQFLSLMGPVCAQSLGLLINRKKYIITGTYLSIFFIKPIGPVFLGVPKIERQHFWEGPLFLFSYWWRGVLKRRLKRPTSTADEIMN